MPSTTVPVLEFIPDGPGYAVRDPAGALLGYVERCPAMPTVWNLHARRSAPVLEQRSTRRLAAAALLRWRDRQRGAERTRLRLAAFRDPFLGATAPDDEPLTPLPRQLRSVR